MVLVLSDQWRPLVVLSCLFFKVLGLLAVTAPVALSFGFAGAMAARSHFPPLSWLGKAYIAIVRGVPDIAFLPLFFVIASGSGF